MLSSIVLGGDKNLMIWQTIRQSMSSICLMTSSLSNRQAMSSICLMTSSLSNSTKKLHW